MLTYLPIDIQPGRSVIIDGLRFFFDRVDLDGSVTFSPPMGSGRGAYMVEGNDGHPRKPSCDEIMALFGSKRFVPEDIPLADSVRQAARDPGYDRKQILEMDATAEFRTLVLEAMDREREAGTLSFSFTGLRSFIQNLLQENEGVRNAPGAWEISPRTLKEMYETRGTPGSRRLADGMSMRGRGRTKHKLGHPEEIAIFHLTGLDPRGSNIHAAYVRYKAEIILINKGDNADRPLFVQDANGKWGPGPDRVNYLKPSTPHRWMSESKFRRLVREGSDRTSYGVVTTAQGAEAAFDGGGFGDRPARVGELCSMDDTEIPALFLFDRETMLPLGQVTLTVLICCFSRMILGWHVGWEAASASTAIRTVLHANLPKDLPEEYDERFPDLKYARLTPATIKLDNLAGHHANRFRDAMADQGTGVRYTGSRCPMDKADVERVIQTIQELITTELAEANFDIARMRRYGFDPDIQQLCTLEELLPVLVEAICFYNTSRHEGLQNRQPHCVYRKAVAGVQLGVLNDVEKLEMSCGHVEYDVKIYRWGFKILDGRYGDKNAMLSVFEDFRAARNIPKGDVTPKQDRRQIDDRKQECFRAKIKVDEEDIGWASVWNPHSEPPGYVRFRAADATRHGMPLWFHQRAVEEAAHDADEYQSEEDELVAYHRFAERLRKLNPHHEKRLLRDKARAASSPRLQKMLRGNVGIVDDDGSHLPDDTIGMAGPSVTHESSGLSPAATPTAPEAYMELEIACDHRIDGEIKLPPGARVAPTRSASRKNPKSPVPARSRAEPSAAKRGRKKSTVTKTTRASEGRRRRSANRSGWGEY